MPPTDVPAAEQGDLPDHTVPADLVELHQLFELAETGDDEQG